MIKVSVIIPVYNVEKYLKECLDSICNQTMPLSDYEVIIIDDGSTDNSAEIASDMANQYDNIILIKQKNSGASAARNAGLNKASGEYIGFIDSDDWVESTMLQTLYSTAKKNNADVIFFNLYRNNDEKMKPYLKSGVYNKEQIKKDIYPRLISSVDEKLYGKTLRGAICCKFFRRSLIDENNIRYDEKLIYNEDALFSISATLLSNVYVYLGDSYLYHNRVNSESITKRYIDNLWVRQKQMIPQLLKICKSSDYDFGNQINKKLFDIAVYSVENEVKRKNRNNIKSRISNIRSITGDKDLRSAINKISSEKLKKIDKAYLFCFKHKFAVLSYLTAKYRYRNNKMF